MGVPRRRGAAVPSCAANTPVTGSTNASLQNAIANAGAAAKRTIGPAYVVARTATRSTRRGDMGAKPHPPTPSPQCGVLTPLPPLRRAERGACKVESGCSPCGAAPNCALDAPFLAADVPHVDPRPHGRGHAPGPTALRLRPARRLDDAVRRAPHHHSSDPGSCAAHATAAARRRAAGARGGGHAATEARHHPHAAAAAGPARERAGPAPPPPCRAAGGP